MLHTVTVVIRLCGKVRNQRVGRSNGFLPHHLTGVEITMIRAIMVYLGVYTVELSLPLYLVKFPNVSLMLPLYSNPVLCILGSLPCKFQI